MPDTISKTQAAQFYPAAHQKTESPAVHVKQDAKAHWGSAGTGIAHPQNSKPEVPTSVALQYEVSVVGDGRIYSQPQDNLFDVKEGEHLGEFWRKTVVTDLGGMQQVGDETWIQVSGKTETGQEITGWMREAGLEPLQSIEVPEGGLQGANAAGEYPKFLEPGTILKRTDAESVVLPNPQYSKTWTEFESDAGEKAWVSSHPVVREGGKGIEVFAELGGREYTGTLSPGSSFQFTGEELQDEHYVSWREVVGKNEQGEEVKGWMPPAHWGETPPQSSSLDMWLASRL